MVRDEDEKQEDNNKEYAAAYSRGRSGDVVRDFVSGWFENTSIEKSGYEQGRQDRHDHGFKPQDECGTGETKDDSGGCYLTTACSIAMKLDDECLELRTLRGFRDNVLLPTSAGKRAVKEYYLIAPQIVAEINHRDDSRFIWKMIYSDVKRAVNLVQNGNFNEAFEQYRLMILNLKNSYLK